MHDQVRVLGILMFELGLERAKERLLVRGKTSGRNDDNPESIAQRFQTFQHQTLPVIDEFESVFRISADDPPDQVFQATKRVMMEILQRQQQS